MKPIKTQIEELEREIDKIGNTYFKPAECLIKGIDGKKDLFESWRILKAKLKTLKECKKMFDDYNKKLDKELFDCMTNGVVDVELYFRRKEKLSKEVLGE